MQTPHPNSPLYDAVIIGGGAAGLSAALMLGRAGRNVVVVDAGSPRNRFAAHMHGVLGHEGKPPRDLVEEGRKEVAGYGITFLDDTVERVEDRADGLVVVTTRGQECTTRSLIVATGVSDELPDVPGLAPRWGIDVLHCPYCHGWEFRGQRIGVLATQPASLHQVRMVRQWSETVTFFSAAVGSLDDADVRSLRSRNVAIVEEPAIEVVVEDDHVTAVRTADGKLTPVDAIFTAAPTRPHDDFLANLSLERTEAPFGGPSVLAVDGTGKTSHPRVWAVGNVVNPGANVPMVMGAGSFTGASVNGWLVQDDFDAAVLGASDSSRDDGASGS